jgi:hypothetical protein
MLLLLVIVTLPKCTGLCYKAYLPFRKIVVNNKFLQGSKRKANSATPSPANSGHLNNGNNGSGHQVESSATRVSVSISSAKM